MIVCDALHDTFLRALAVHNERSKFVVLLTGDQHGPKARQARQNRHANPRGEKALRLRDDSYLHRGGGQGLHLLDQTRAEASVQGGAARQDDVVVVIQAVVEVALHDGGVDALVHAHGLLA